MKVDLNSGMEGLHGQLDGYVYRTYRGKQIRQKKPVFSGEWGAGTITQRGNFGSADKWYKEVVKPNAGLVAHYRKKGQKKKLNYRQMAIGDYLNPPEVRAVSIQEPVRGQGFRLFVSVRDDFEVVRVTGILRDTNGDVFHQADAERVKNDFFLTLPMVSGAKKAPASIEVTAFDRPGNKHTKTFPLVLPQPTAEAAAATAAVTTEPTG
jgi:hypothetical protein